MTHGVSPSSLVTNPWATHTVRVRSITPEVADVATYHLSFEEPSTASAYRFAPGQFNMLYLPGVGEVPISLSADPGSSTTWAHTIRAVGHVTQQIARLQVGDTLGLRGPFGSSWPLSAAEGRDLVIVAGGLGLAPLRPAICETLQHAERFRSLTLLYGARSPDTILFESEFADWSRRGMNVQVTVDRADATWAGHVGVVTLLIDRLPLRDPQQTGVFVCGPEVMMKFVGRSALARGIPESQVWLSMERNMQCAIGLCGHCQLGPTFVCKDGPVFRHDRLAPLLTVEGL